jgi:hypothetical protein
MAIKVNHYRNNPRTFFFLTAALNVIEGWRRFGGICCIYLRLHSIFPFYFSPKQRDSSLFFPFRASFEIRGPTERLQCMLSAPAQRRVKYEFSEFYRLRTETEGVVIKHAALAVELVRGSRLEYHSPHSHVTKH